MKKSLLVLASLLFLYGAVPAWAQSENALFPPGFRTLNFSSQLPEDIFHTKSVVFVHTSAAKGNWKELSRLAHTSFRKAGIDAVAYYYFGDVRAGRDVSRQLKEVLAKREIKNIVLISQGNKKSALLITPFSHENTFVADGQQAYQQEAMGSEQLFLDFEKVAARSNLEVQNLLINDQPEFFVGAGSLVKGKRFEAFAQDLKLDKLAVPKFQEGDMLLMQGTSDSSQSVEGQIEDYNQQLQQLMADYPYEYGLVEPAAEEDKLRQSEGYQFILLKLHTTEPHIRDMLGYKEPKDNTRQKGRQAAAAQEPVYKYYIKHIYTGDVYLGEVWDADKDWQVALGNYIRQMKEKLNIGQ